MLLISRIVRHGANINYPIPKDQICLLPTSFPFFFCTKKICLISCKRNLMKLLRNLLYRMPSHPKLFYIYLFYVFTRKKKNDLYKNFIKTQLDLLILWILHNIYIFTGDSMVMMFLYSPPVFSFSYFCFV